MPFVKTNTFIASPESQIPGGYDNSGDISYENIRGGKTMPPGIDKDRHDRFDASGDITRVKGVDPDENVAFRPGFGVSNRVYSRTKGEVVNTVEILDALPGHLMGDSDFHSLAGQGASISAYTEVNFTRLGRGHIHADDSDLPSGVWHMRLRGTDALDASFNSAAFDGLDFPQAAIIFGGDLLGNIGDNVHGQIIAPVIDGANRGVLFRPEDGKEYSMVSRDAIDPYSRLSNSSMYIDTKPGRPRVFSSATFGVHNSYVFEGLEDSDSLIYKGHSLDL